MAPPSGLGRSSRYVVAHERSAFFDTLMVSHSAPVHPDAADARGIAEKGEAPGLYEEYHVRPGWARALRKSVAHEQEFETLRFFPGPRGRNFSARNRRSGARRPLPRD